MSTHSAAARGGSETVRHVLDAVVQRVAARKDAWVRVGIPERMELLRNSLDGVVEVAGDWVRLGCEAKGIDPKSPLSGEEWVSGPMTTVRHLRLMIDALAAGGEPPPHDLGTGPAGHVIAHVFPRGLLEHLAFSGMKAEVWIQPGQPASQGRLYREKRAGSVRPGRVALVLGAGNISSIGPLDVVYKLFVEDEVCVLKMNPVNEYLAPVFARAFRALIGEGVLQIVTGGAEVGEYLCRHPGIDAIHLTGSDRTHDAIVWGPTPEEQARRKAAGEPVVSKSFTSELGCVTPVLVVPGRWTRRQLEYQAQQVASMVAHNGSFNCNAAKIVAVARGWAQREEFMERLAHAMSKLPQRRAYYPGADARWQAFRDRYPRSLVLGEPGKGVVPWTLIPDVPAVAGEYALTNEAFCGVIAQVTLEADDALSFFDAATRFANDVAWGSLSCVVLVDPKTEKEHKPRVEQFIGDLRYGDVGVNVWTGANFSLGVTSWGAFPGNRPQRVESGIGVVHNTFLFDYPEKSVVRGPFVMFPKPIWFACHRTLGKMGPKLVRFEAKPSWWKLPALGLLNLRA